VRTPAKLGALIGTVVIGGAEGRGADAGPGPHGRL